MRAEPVMNENIQNAFGYFGKLPSWGDFIQQLLPQDFANGWHEWLQISMASARESLVSSVRDRASTKSVGSAVTREDSVSWVRVS